MRESRRIWVGFLAVAVLGFVCLAIGAEPPADLKANVVRIAEKERQEMLGILSKNQDALVLVELVVNVKTSFGGRQMPAKEQKLTIDGTVIDPSGLTVVSNSQCDPMAMMRRFSRAARSSKFSMDANVLQVKIILNDGTELPAKIVLKDPDLDLAFVRPDKADLKLPRVTLCPSCEPKLLDSAVCISRLDMSTGRAPFISVGQVMAVISKPRTHYMVNAMPSAGRPAFTTKGKCFGILLSRIGGGQINMSDPSKLLTAFLPVVLPAEDILEAVEQIPPREE